MHFPKEILVQPLAKVPSATIQPPGSKSITNRALVLAALATRATGTFQLRGCLESEDVDVMVDSLRKLGYHLDVDWEPGLIGSPADTSITVKSDRRDRFFDADHADLFVANSGTTMRFLTAMVCLGQGKYRLDGVARMRERPIQDLLEALRQLGVDAESEGGTGCPPVLIHANGLSGGAVKIKGDVSSQFLSGLLMAVPFASGDTTIHVEGTLVSIPYVEMTVAMLRDFGVQIECEDYHRFVIPGNQRVIRTTYAIEPDASAASYFFAAAAITGGTVTVTGLPTASLQGDVRFVDVLERMGCAVERKETGITVRGGSLRGVDVDMNDISDTVMTLGAVACFAEGPTTIRNVGHIRHKETDRLTALANELRRVGATVDESADGLRIQPAPLHGANIETYRDHRMAMSLALVGLKVPGIRILDPGCVSKTYPRFFEDLKRLG